MQFDIQYSKNRTLIFKRKHKKAKHTLMSFQFLFSSQLTFKVAIVLQNMLVNSSSSQPHLEPQKMHTAKVALFLYEIAATMLLPAKTSLHNTSKPLLKFRQRYLLCNKITKDFRSCIGSDKDQTTRARARKKEGQYAPFLDDKCHVVFAYW